MGLAASVSTKEDDRGVVQHAWVAAGRVELALDLREAVDAGTEVVRVQPSYEELDAIDDLREDDVRARFLFIYSTCFSLVSHVGTGRRRFVASP